jgi:hypothetical protein
MNLEKMLIHALEKRNFIERCIADLRMSKRPPMNWMRTKEEYEDHILQALESAEERITRLCTLLKADEAHHEIPS